MRRISCEMCQSTEIVKQDSFFVCQSCGTKYTLEEARKIILDGPIDITGSTVRIDMSGNIDNYYSLAQHAYNTRNFREAESYCNKILEIDSSNAKAWALKGLAVGYDSNCAKLRLSEMNQCLTSALRYSSKEEMDEMKSDFFKQIIGISLAMINSGSVLFEKNVSEEAYVILLRVIGGVLTDAISFLTRYGQNTIWVRSQIANRLGNGAVQAWNTVVVPQYGINGHPNDNEWNTYIERGDRVVNLLNKANSVCPEDRSGTVGRYRNMIAIEQLLVNSSSYVIGFKGRWVQHKLLNPASKQARLGIIRQWQSAINQIESK